MPNPAVPRPALTRRGALLGLAAAFSLGGSSLALAAAPSDRRFVVIILRGALDGMAAVVPYGDPDLVRWRPDLLPPPPGSDGGLRDLGGFWGLHPALGGLHDLYKANQLLPIHAVAGAWRTRSHFDAQDFLECGADHRMTSGWLNRVVQAIPPGAAAAGSAIAVSVGVPLLLRGPATVGAWAPQNFGTPAPDLYARVAALHAQDSVTGRAITEGLRERGFTAAALSGTPPIDAGRRNAFPNLAAAAGRLLAAPDGPRIAALEIGGWDTHADQKGRLKAPLEQLDQGISALRAGLADAWGSTVVLVMTEFGRTVRMNGTRGTDHGTGTVAFVAGGAVAGGRVGGAWPGLAQDRLLENRDLMPTTDLRAVAKSLLAQHYRLAPTALANIFPGSDAVHPMPHLLHA
jgi:uncharacterized protein (DUF1501 family)